MIRQLGLLGHQIELICFPQTDPVITELEVAARLGTQKCSFIRRGPLTPRYKALAAARHMITHPLAPLTMREFYEPRLKKALFEGVATDAEIMVCDTLHVWGAVSNALPFIIYRAHNVESQIWKRASKHATNPILRILLAFQAWCVFSAERSLARRANAVATVSDTDAKSFTDLYGAERVVTVPIGFNFEAPLAASPGKTVNLLFVGKLDWPPNAEGLRWFLRDIWPKAAAKRPQLRLRIVGSGRKPDFSPLEGVEFLGRVTDLVPLYRQCDLAIVPVRYGSGTRVKAIEAARYGRALLSTGLGVEGLALDDAKHYLRAESAAEWIQVLTRVTRLECAELGARAFQHLREDFDERNCAKRFETLLPSNKG
ncbi:glycosyltransferase [Aminobacter aminovorans]|nr:glycosyltransferase [Aminobacter aminovorans]